MVGRAARSGHQPRRSLTGALRRYHRDVPSLLNQVIPALRLTRVATALAAVSNAWFVILWTRAAPEEIGPAAQAETPLWALLAIGAVVAVGIFAYGAALNDLLDVRRDRALHPERPLPSGQISLEAAIGIIAGMLLVATLASTVLGLGAVVLSLLTCSAILFFNGVAKHVPSVGVVSVSLIYGAHMIIPNVRLEFVWPVWLVMSHSLLIAIVVHVVGGRRPRLSRRALISAIAGWVFWSGVLLFVGWRRSGALWPDWVSPVAALGPAAGAIAFIVYLLMTTTRGTGARPRTAARVGRTGSCWLAIYNCGWLVGQGYSREALLLGSFAAVGWIAIESTHALIDRTIEPLEYRM